MNISVSDLLRLTNPNIIDIRTVEHFNNNHMPGAKNIGMQALLLNPNKYLNTRETYYIYCQRGISSQKLCQILRSQGYNTISVIGGYEAWLLEK